MHVMACVVISGDKQLFSYMYMYMYSTMLLTRSQDYVELIVQHCVNFVF